MQDGALDDRRAAAGDIEAAPTDANRDPIVRGDLLFNPGWSKKPAADANGQGGHRR
jgi:hypothetical protein